MSENLFDLTGRVALVTGASRGLGQYFARALARAGAALVVTSRNLDRLHAFEKEIQALGRRVLALELDVTDHDSIQHGIAAAEREFGHIDVLVNNAGCNVRKPALDVTWNDWNVVVDTSAASSWRRRWRAA